ncbi:hypothetical protein QQP08_012683 [Theobroma cacao]|nr:hypothetical protein QQP08_012683 [Theobroma cacao]
MLEFLRNTFLTFDDNFFLFMRVCFEQIVHSRDNLGIWHRLPVILGLIHLAARRHLHQEYNLLNVGQSPSGVRFNPGNYPYRTSDGRFNDPFNEGAGTCFLLIINIRKYLKLVQLMRPDPMVVATKLLAWRK